MCDFIYTTVFDFIIILKFAEVKYKTELYTY